MRLLSIAQPDALFTVMGARVYHGMATEFEPGALIAIHAGAEPPSWAELERRIKGDKHLLRALIWYGLDSAESLKRLPLGAVIGVVRLQAVHDAAQFDDPPLCRIDQKKFFWRLEPVRLIRSARASQPVGAAG